MTNLIANVAASAPSYTDIISGVDNPVVRRFLMRAKACLNMGDNSMFNFYLEEARKAIRDSFPVDYTPKKGVVEKERMYHQSPTKQEVDFEDAFLLKKQACNDTLSWCYEPSSKDKGCFNSKTKSKWARSGRLARVLSNR